MAQDQPRDERKVEYKAYQQRAREQAQAINRVLDREVVSVGISPTVWETPEGAFVEAVVWVPKERDGT